MKIIEGMKGKIWLDSKKGIGTTFHLLFPKETIIQVESNEKQGTLN